MDVRSAVLAVSVAVVAGSGACGGGTASPSDEGCMVSGYPSDATENAGQATIVAAGYSK